MQRSLSWWIAASAILYFGLTGCAESHRAASADAAPVHAAPADTQAPSVVTALGRLEPDVGVIDVGAPPGDRIRELHVQEGDTVEQGRVLAVLESFPARSAARRVAEARVEQARRALQRAVELEPAAVATRRATLTRAEATLRLAESDLKRTRALVEEEVVPPRDLEHQQTVVDEARAGRDNARAALDQETITRTLAVSEARAELVTAESALEQAVAELEQSEIRAPVSGRVLDIAMWPGESTDGGPLMRLGAVDRMMAVAEVYETDARYIRVGQAATITSPALPQPLTGRVELVADLIQRNGIHDIDPRADTDSRVVEARILLDKPQPADNFVHLQVDVRIECGPTDGP